MSLNVPFLNGKILFQVKHLCLSIAGLLLFCFKKQKVIILKELHDSEHTGNLAIFFHLLGCFQSLTLWEKLYFAPRVIFFFFLCSTLVYAWKNLFLQSLARNLTFLIHESLDISFMNKNVEYLPVMQANFDI